MSSSTSSIPILRTASPCPICRGALTCHDRDIGGCEEVDEYSLVCAFCGLLAREVVRDVPRAGLSNEAQYENRCPYCDGAPGSHAVPLPSALTYANPAFRTQSVKEGFVFWRGEDGEVHLISVVRVGQTPADSECEDYEAPCGATGQSWYSPAHCIPQTFVARERPLDRRYCWTCFPRVRS